MIKRIIGFILSLFRKKNMEPKEITIPIKDDCAYFIMEDGSRIPVDEYYRGLKSKLEGALNSYRACKQAHQMTGLPSFGDAAEMQRIRMNKIDAEIKRNLNLYCIINNGYSLN